MLVCFPENRRYLSGFTGSNAALFIHEQRRALFTDFRYLQMAGSESPDFDILPVNQFVSIWDSVALAAREAGARCVGFESDHVTVEWLNLVKKEFPINLLPCPGIIEDLRAYKDAEEIEAIAQANAYSVDALEHVLPLVKPGVSELDLSGEIQYRFAKKGYPISFIPIVASGPNGSMPHKRATERKIQAGEFVTFDFGCRYKGYCGDFTRTVAVGSPTDEMRSIYQIVLDAQKLALERIKPGALCRDVDRAARGYIAEKGYGDYFGHGLGHSVGLEVHEEPRFTEYCGAALGPGICISIEPGIYLPNRFGVRIEDIVCVTSDGYRNFISAPKELLVL
jgi:Xaa-Pro aminopeptidase